MKKILCMVFILSMFITSFSGFGADEVYSSELDTSAYIDDSFIYVDAARFIAGNVAVGTGPYAVAVFGVAMEWFDDLKESCLNTNVESTDKGYSEEELYLLSKIVTVESGDTSEEMALAIANTILNRVKSPDFPDTVKGVVYQVDIHVQFPPAHRDSFATLEPLPVSIAAARDALEGVNNIDDALYFNNQPFASKADDLIDVIDGEFFYR